MQQPPATDTNAPSQDMGSCPVAGITSTVGSVTVPGRLAAQIRLVTGARHEAVDAGRFPFDLHSHRITSLCLGYVAAAPSSASSAAA